MEKILWLVLGGVAFAAALRAGGSTRAMRIGRVALGVLFLGAGAVVNAVYLATGEYFLNFADAAHFAFVRDTWQSLVAPNQYVFISLLIIFEAAAGLLILSGGRRTQLGLISVIGMHVGLLVFGWITTIWALVMLVTFTLLLRAERHHAAATSVTAAAASGLGDRLSEAKDIDAVVVGRR